MSVWLMPMVRTLKKDSEAAHAIIKSFPYVEDLTSSSNLIVDGLSGSGVTTDDGKWLSMRWMMADKNFAPFMKLDFVKGRNLAAPDEILVNETFLRMMHWKRILLVGKCMIKI